MAIYEAFKDVLGIAQKAGNIDLYKQLLDLSAQALDLQAENQRLTDENKQLKEIAFIDEKVIRHEQPYITLAGDEAGTMYCSTCWSTSKQLVQVAVYDAGEFFCPKCNFRGVYSQSLKDAAHQKMLDSIASMRSDVRPRRPKF